MEDSAKDGAPAPENAASHPANRDKATNSWVFPAVTTAIVLSAFCGGTLVELRHFEYLESDAETDNQKVILLQRLTEREATQITAIMIAAPSSIGLSPAISSS